MTYDEYERCPRRRDKGSKPDEGREEERTMTKKKQRLKRKREKLRWGQLAARLAANFGFSIVALAVSPLVKSSLKDFAVSIFLFFSILAFAIHCRGLSLPMSLAVPFPPRPVLPFAHTSPRARRFLFASTLFPFFPSSSTLLFLHFLPANLWRRLFPLPGRQTRFHLAVLYPRGYFTFASSVCSPAPPLSRSRTRSINWRNGAILFLGSGRDGMKRFRSCFTSANGNSLYTNSTLRAYRLGCTVVQINSRCSCRAS